MITSPLWWRELRWRQAERSRREVPTDAPGQGRERLSGKGWKRVPGGWVYRHQSATRSVLRFMSDTSAGLLGLALGTAVWPLWWPLWTAWAWMAMGATLGVLTSRMVWARWLS